MAEIKVALEDLTEEEIEKCIETFYSIREVEEQRERTETTDEYPEPMHDKQEIRELLKSCSLFKDANSGYIIVLI